LTVLPIGLTSKRGGKMEENFKNEDHTAFCDMVLGSDSGFSEGDQLVLYLHAMMEKWGLPLDNPRENVNPF
jgi:hypothetical protein